jgi:hypothetical protein
VYMYFHVWVPDLESLQRDNTVPAKSLGRYKKLNNFFQVIVRPLKSSFTEKGLYTAVQDEILLL